MIEDWVSREPGRDQLYRELNRLKTRALSRKWRALLVAVIAASAVVGLQLRKPRTFQAGVVLTMTEGVIYDEVTPPPKSELRDYIRDVSFNKRHLLQVMEKFQLYQNLLAIDEQLAVDSMWDDLEVEVYQNQFLEDSDDRVRRSARLAIRYKAENASLATDVARELVRKMIEFEHRKRREAARAGYANIEAAVRTIEQQIDERTDEINKKYEQFDKATDAQRVALNVELFRLQAQLRDQQSRLEDLNRAASIFQLRLTIEESGNRGLVFEVVDEQPPDLHDPRPLQLSIIGTIVLLITLPLAGLVLAAFDSRVYDSGDVMRLGVPVVGHVPRFQGSRAGALSTRRKS